MTAAHNETGPPISRRKRLSFGVFLVGFVIVATFMIAETLLRVLPIPGITYHTFYYDELTGQRYYRNTTYIYRNERGRQVTREVNSWGYLDADHDYEKPVGTKRIGFFGDSFTEARQVELGETFHKRAENTLNTTTGVPVECIAISMSGYGTLQSYLEYQRWGDRLDLDWVVYVFCENDPADHIREIKRANALPYPYIENDSLRVDFSFREAQRRKTRVSHRAWQYLKSNYLVFSTLETRLKLLRARGIQIKVAEGEKDMSHTPGRERRLTTISLPSTWPDSLVQRAEVLGEKVILDWRDAVATTGRDFAILYIPRQRELGKPAAEQDSWASWLMGLCARNGIDLIDPSELFVERRRQGQTIYQDHLSTDGHRAMSDVFVDEFRKLTEEDPR